MSITVAELIAKLQEHPADAVVYSQGCDCSKEAEDVTFDKEANIVEVRRQSEPEPPERDPRAPGVVDVDHDVTPSE